MSAPATTNHAEPVRVGLVLQEEFFARPFNQRAQLVNYATEAGVDHLAVGDHVVFRDGSGFDAMVNATSLTSMHQDVQVVVAVYLLALRHPVPVARQLLSHELVAPGRLTFGVGLGGDDRQEFTRCGVDPKTRGLRLDEHLEVLRGLLSGMPFSFSGNFLDLEETVLTPGPLEPIPILVGGRSDKAAERAGRFGDGWIGIWCSARRFSEVTDLVADAAHASGRAPEWQHHLDLWAGLDEDPERARGLVAARMEELYKVDFAKFDRYTPVGPAESLAEELASFVEVGCRSFSVTAVASSLEAAIETVGEAKAILAKEVTDGA